MGLGLAVLRDGEVTDGGAELSDAWPMGIGGQAAEGVGLTAAGRTLKRMNLTDKDLF